MFKNKKILAIIPARGGSKRLKNKNLLTLGNKPLFMWTLKFAKNSKIFDKIYLSTDSKKIFEKTKKERYCDCPNLRKKNLSRDKSNLVDVCEDVIKYYLKDNINFDGIVLLQPTSPFRKIKTLKKMLDSFFKDNVKGLSTISMKKASKNPLLSFNIKNKRSVQFFKNQNMSKQSNQLKSFYYPNGSFYVFSPNTILKKKNIFTEKNKFIVIDDFFENIDIDTKFDFQLSQILSKKFL